ncbi:MAG: sugar phosphate isomerase/epimerase family protein [Armatimonadota bacterium]
MRIGINAWSFPAKLTMPQAFRLAKSAGFDCVELNVAEEGYLTPDSDEAAVAALRRSAENMSLEVRSVCTGLFWKYSFTSNDQSTVERAMEIARRSLRIARWLGADTLLVVPGTVTKDVPYDLAYERALSALKGLAPEAERLGVRIGVENVWNKFLLSPLEMRDFIDAVDSPMVGSYFDAGNVLVNGYPEHWIRILGSRIIKIHVKDFQTAIGNASGFANPLEGDMDWRAVARLLKEIGYDDVITAEIAGYKTLPELGIKHAGDSLKRVFKGAS